MNTKKKLSKAKFEKQLDIRNMICDFIDSMRGIEDEKKGNIEYAIKLLTELNKEND